MGREPRTMRETTGPSLPQIKSLTPQKLYQARARAPYARTVRTQFRGRIPKKRLHSAIDFEFDQKPMKYCPTCKTRYDEEILRFCMKDGTPLLEEEEPNFIEMPSAELDQNVEDEGEVTVIRRNPVVPPPPPTPDDDMVFDQKAEPSQRIVVPTFEEQRAQQSRAVPYQAPPKTNVFKVVVLTIIGTVAVLGLAFAGLWMLQRDNNANNSNVNGNLGNINTNLNTNIGIDTNFNFNTSANFNTNLNTNANTNANIKTPTPTPRPSPSVTPAASPTPDDDSPTPTRTPIPTPSPIIIRPGSPTPRSPSNSPVNGGVLNGRATSLPTPSYPTIAKTVGASGQVTVQVQVDERGNVVSARAVSGHPLLRSAAESAARRSKISSNERLNGVLVYNFKSN